MNDFNEELVKLRQYRRAHSAATFNLNHAALALRECAEKLLAQQEIVAAMIDEFADDGAQ